MSWACMHEYVLFVECRRHKKRKQEEMQFIKGNKKHHGGYSSGGGLTSKGPIVDGRALFVCTLEILSTSMCWLTHSVHLLHAFVDKHFAMLQQSNMM